MEQMRQAKQRRIAQQLRRRVMVSGLTLGSGCVEYEVGVAKQPLDRRGRDALFRMMSEDDSAFMVGQRYQSDNEPVLIGDQALKLRGLACGTFAELDNGRIR